MPSPVSHPGSLPVLSPSDRDAREHVARWLDHIAAGRIGAPRPGPEPDGQVEYSFASLGAIVRAARLSRSAIAAARAGWR